MFIVFVIIGLFMLIKFHELIIQGLRILIDRTAESIHKLTGTSKDNCDKFLIGGLLFFCVCVIVFAFTREDTKIYNTETKASYLCTYPSCNNEKYGLNDICFRHMCSEDGCTSLGTANTMFTYCEYHEKELTCADPSCYQPKYFARGSDYCQTHYDDYE